MSAGKTSNNERETLKARPATPSRSVSDSGSSLFFRAGLLIVITFLAYLPAIKAGFIWDDEDLLYGNPLVKGGLADIWFTTKFYDYYPLTLTSLWLEWRLWGMHPMNYHIANILLHSATAVFFWRVLLRLKIPGAWFAALVFAIHPVNVESVAWIAERKNTLPMVFYALSILWFLRDTEIKSETNALRASRWYWLSLAAFLLALLSKTSVVMLPFVLLGCVWWLNGRTTKSDLLRSIPFFGLSLVLSLVTIWVQYHRAISTDVVQTGGFAERLARAGWAVWFYLWKAILPLNLSFVYPRWQVNPHSIVSYLPGVALLGCFPVFWKFRATWGRPLLFALGYFVVTLFPVLGFFSIYFLKYSYVADHWQYTSIIGVIALIVGLAGRYRQKFPMMPVAGGFVAIALAILTWKQSSIYANDEVLFRDTLKKNPKCWMAHHNLGVEIMQQAEFAGRSGNVSLATLKINEAIEHYQETLKLKPDHANCHYNLGFALRLQDKIDEALEEFRKAIQYDPELVGAAQAVAWDYATNPDPRKRNAAEAVRLAENAAKSTDHQDPMILDTLAAAYAEAGRFDDAINTAGQAAEIAQKAGDIEMARQIQGRLRFYRGGRPLRDTMRSR